MSEVPLDFDVDFELACMDNEQLQQTFLPLPPYHWNLHPIFLVIRDRNQPPPIFNLNDDLLWRIFNMNTLTDTDIIKDSSSDHECSLITARHTSQVCAGWRSLMLASSSLWANTINLHHLNQRNDIWRGEIMRRTDNSLLSIIGHLKEGGPTSQFFLSLLGKHWTRLRRISVYVHDPVVVEDERWLSIQNPAPNLEIFSVRFISPPAFSTADDILFSNEAPSIHTFIIRNLNFEVSGRWLSGLLRLDLSRCSVRKIFLFVLAEMLALESLEIVTVDIIDAHAEDRLWPTIILPKLKRLSLNVDLITLIVLIGYVAPTPGCISRYEGWGDTVSLPSAEDIFLLQRGFSTHFQCFSNFWPNDTISWNLKKAEYTSDLINILKAGNNSAFYFRIELDRASQRHGIPNIILHSLYSCDLSSITSFELDIELKVMNLSDLHFAKFCRSLSSVVTMHADTPTMEVLIQLHEYLNGEILFPCLKSIVFGPDAKSRSDIIMRFILQRRDAGVPIAGFDLSHCDSFDLDRLFFLEGINGLDVKWDEKIRNEMYI
ncbi:hypothetical protein GALMADRAFT_271540 [Galerina marginata CBS 339.88]|uniref:F-box domain-containing protein n=1 Tax=Galerina marginata (strain CBS 339.88) TaxID=685588 RepID=A0A067SKF3_GALM3|nr:hypothetical protein GALMADRAFT_271540 [Galerina marginata CBS 339.88]